MDSHRVDGRFVEVEIELKDGEPRVLVRIAKERARMEGFNGFRDEDVFLIGDTRNDVKAARAAKAVAIAVATGGDSLEVLASHDPDHLFPSLLPADAVLAALPTM